MTKLLLILALIGLWSQATFSQDKLYQKELSPQVENDMLWRFPISDSTESNLYGQKEFMLRIGMPVKGVSPHILDRNRILLKHLDWKTASMPIKDPRKGILSRDR